MWYIKFSWTILVFLVFFSLVSGSCLEYGHSCWGAHGKRSGTNRAADAIKQPTAYVDNLADQLFGNSNNDNNNANSIDDESKNNFEAPSSQATLASSQATAQEPNPDGSDAKWRQLLRQHRYQARQMQRQLDANDAAESWRKLQQALAEAERQQRLLKQQQQQQQPIGDFFELNK